jgi:two-component system KDP operon response regulator KdpE
MNEPVLVVDEDASVTKSIVRLLSLHGYAVRGETSAATAITAALEHQPAVIFLDLHMRQCSGIQLAHQMRAQPLLAAARLIGMSATVPDWDTEALALFDSLLSKPVAGETLLAAIRS